MTVDTIHREYHGKQPQVPQLDIDIKVLMSQLQALQSRQKEAQTSFMRLQKQMLTASFGFF